MAWRLKVLVSHMTYCGSNPDPGGLLSHLSFFSLFLVKLKTTTTTIIKQMEFKQKGNELYQCLKQEWLTVYRRILLFIHRKLAVDISPPTWCQNQLTIERAWLKTAHCWTCVSVIWSWLGVGVELDIKTLLGVLFLSLVSYLLMEEINEL